LLTVQLEGREQEILFLAVRCFLTPARCPRNLDLRSRSEGRAATPRRNRSIVRIASQDSSASDLLVVLV
jgi:hypothetical protein